MNFSSLSASDKRTLVLGAIVAVAGILSFMDPSGSWGVVVVIGILGGLLAVYVAVQPQMAPAMKLPATKGMLLLAAGPRSRSCGSAGWPTRRNPRRLRRLHLRRRRRRRPDPRREIRNEMPGEPSPGIFPSWRGETLHLYSCQPHAMPSATLGGSRLRPRHAS
jgi:hypothetical protein